MAQKDDNQSLAKAADSGNWVMVKQMVCGEDLDAADIEKSCLLHKLASDTNISFSLVEDIVDKICSRHVDLLLTDDNGHTAVMAAARCNNWEAVSLLCRKAALPEDTESVIAILQTVARSEDLKKSYKLSHSVLDCLWNGLQQRKLDCQQTDTHSVLSQVGAKLNCWWLVRYLLSTDLDLNLLDEDGLGVIHRLAMGHKDQHVSLLLKVLDKGADINLRNVVGDTAVHIAAKNSNWLMVEALLRQGARADLANNEKQTLLHILAISFPASKDFCENFDTIFTLLQKVPVNIDGTDGRGNTALHLAVKKEKGLVAEKLMDIGARADVVDDNGRTLLHTAASQISANYSSSLLTRFIERGGDLETADTEGNTALQLAAKVNNRIYIQQLKGSEAVESEPTSKGYTGSYTKLPYSLRLQMKDDDLLHWAVQSGDMEMIIDLVKKGASINKPDTEGFTVIQKLVKTNYFENVDSTFGFMVNRGANVNVRTPSGDSLLHLAAKNNNWLIVERLVKLGLSVYEPDSEGFCVLDRLAQDRTVNITLLCRPLRNACVYGVTSVRSPGRDSLLHLAAKHNNFSMVKYLAQQADLKIINQLDSEGLNVLHRLLQYQPEYRYVHDADSVLNILLSMGANPNIRTSSGDTALHLAAKHKKWNVVERLVEHGCDVNEPNSEGFFVIHKLAQTTDLRHESFKSPADGMSKVFQLLLHKQADLSVRCPAGNTALNMAARHNNWNLVERLVEQGCDMNTPDSEGFYILHRFAQRPEEERFLMFTFKDSSSDELFVKFVDKGADLNCKSPHIGTPLHMALKNRKWDLAKRFAELGADVRECDFNGMSVLHIIANQRLFVDQRQCISLIQFLIEKGANVKIRCAKEDSFLHLAAKHDNWEIVQEMICRPICNDEDVNEKDSEGFTILHRAASSQSDGWCSLLPVLLSKGAKCDIPCPSGESALHLAVKHGHWWMIEELLRWKEKVIKLNGTRKQRHWLKHFKVNAKDKSGNTIVHLCAKQGKWDIVHKLLMSSANHGLPDDEGHTILYRLAIERCRANEEDHSRSKVFKILSSIVLHTGETDEFGDTLIQIAARNRNLDFVHILLYLAECVNVKDIDGLTLLHRVVQCKSSQSLETVQIVLSRNEDIEVRCPKGDTALHLAAQSGNWDIVRELLMKGAKAVDIDSEGMSGLHRLVKRERSSCQSERHLASSIPEQQNSKSRDSQLVKLLVDRDVDLNKIDPNSLTPLQLAVMDKEWEMVNALLECGAEINRNAPSGKSFFHELSKDTRVAVEVAESVTKQLVTRGLDINQRDSGGDTPLNLAAKHQNWRVVRLFAEVGADASIPDSEGWFVCHRLAMCNYYFCHDPEMNVLDLLSLFTKSGFDVNQKGPDGKSSLQTALKHYNWKMVWLLVQFGASYELSLDEKKKTLDHMLSELPATNTDLEKIKSFISHVIDKGLCASSQMQREIVLCERKALKEVISRCNWDFAKTLVECGLDINTEDYDEPLLHFVVSKYFASETIRDAYFFLDALLARGVDINCRNKEGRTVLFQNFRGFVSNRGMNTPNPIIHVLLDKGADPALADGEGISLLKEAVELEYRSAISAVNFLIELGVSTHQPALTEAASKQKHPLRQSSCLNTSVRSPTQRAFEKNNVVVLKMLVESGASSSKELFELNTRYQGQLAFKDRKSTEELEMLDILRDAASEPRSLKSLCRQTVSHALGCGPRRKEKVVSLPVPASLQDYVLFSDVLSAAFLDSERELVKRNSQHSCLNFSFDSSLYLSEEFHEPHSYNDYCYYNS